MRRIAALMVCGLMSTSCVPDYVTQNSADVIMVITIIDPTVVRSDVSLLEPDFVNVGIAVRFKNLKIETPNVPNAVFLERYEIRYVRSDGRNTEGVDVPHRVTGALSTVEDVRDSGGISVVVEVVRVQAKLEAPLRQLRLTDPANGELPDAGGAIVLTVFAEITLYGRTLEGAVVQDTGRVQIDFADWP